MKQLISIVLCFALGACTTQELQSAEKIAVPIAEAVAVAAGAYYGVPPTASIAVINGANSLWGAVQQAQAGQPVDQGAVSTSIGKAIVGATAGMTQTQKISALTAAATLLQTQGVPSDTDVNMWPGGRTIKADKYVIELHRRLARDAAKR